MANCTFPLDILNNMTVNDSDIGISSVYEHIQSLFANSGTPILPKANSKLQEANTTDHIKETATAKPTAEKDEGTKIMVHNAPNQAHGIQGHSSINLLCDKQKEIACKPSEEYLLENSRQNDLTVAEECIQPKTKGVHTVICPKCRSLVNDGLGRCPCCESDLKNALQFSEVNSNISTSQSTKDDDNGEWPPDNGNYMKSFFYPLSYEHNVDDYESSDYEDSYYEDGDYGFYDYDNY